ncbi:MAG: TM0106 family RecB-like putative nuclease [Synechococcaceae cyanobacterium]|nr:TM0106 family RecB-like putative nuclease [Synechococcaceae cyanobacterium]
MTATANRLITPTQLALFSRSPLIGTWWEELHRRDAARAPRPATDALDDLLFKSGHRHEELLIERLEADGKGVARLSGGVRDEDYARTLTAMQEGHDYIHQASLRNDELRGSADLLERIAIPSLLGSWSYIPIECKLSSHSKPIYLVQACAYCELLEPLLGHRPDRFRLYLGGRRFEAAPDGYRSDEFWSWYQQLRQRYRVFIASFDPQAPPQDAPGDHGGWQPLIEERLEQQRDLILVAGMRQSQRRRLRAAGITTIDQLAAAPAEPTIPGLDPAILLRLQEQARIQTAPPQADGRPAVVIRPVEQQSKGLALLPRPDAGDIWFDMEGYPDPLSGSKLEYLFGACHRDANGQRQFTAWWAHDEREERDAFDGFMQWVQQRRTQHPDLHVYHYASYEKTALGNLASRHQLHQPLWDQWLREELFVDLYPIVRHGLLLGAPSYSIKKVEGLYLSGARQEEVTTAADSVVQYAEWIKSGEPRQPGRDSGQSARLQDLEDYNRKDCESTEELHSYLQQLPIWQELTHRPNRWDGGEIADSEAEPAAAFERDLELAARCLREEIPEKLDDPMAIGPRGLSWTHQKLLAQLVDFQEREGKVEWWEFFNRINGMSAEERDDDTEVIAAAVRDGAPEQLTSQSRGYRYRFSALQPLKLAARAGQQLRFAIAPLLTQPDGALTAQDIVRRSDGKAFDVEGVFDADAPCVVTLKLSGRKLRELQGLGHDDLPGICDLIPLPKQIYKRMLPDLVRQAQAWVNAHQPLPAAMQHLLERRAIPALRDLNAVIRLNPEATAVELAAFLGSADGLTLSLQGPPGSGKTTVTGELIARLVQQGQRIAVSSQGHEAINNLLKRTQSRLDQLGGQGLVVKLSSSTSEASDQRSFTDSAVQALRESAISRKPDVLGATVFSLVKESYGGAPFDLLVIDEAGQVSLSNLLYMSQCARNILLVGDQQQLSQPNRAKHPDDSGLSCLDYVMDGQPVVPPDRGVFLATSWRMPPVLTDLVSQLFYQGELQGSADNAANRVLWDGRQQGLLFQPVEHDGNGSASDEEVEAIAALVERLLGQPHARMHFRDGSFHLEERPLTPDDIMITAPYNLQVNRLQRRLGHQARVGTVDRFQGLQAPVAIHSLTASDGDSAPRGLAFVLDPNRLNVAISRAQCLSIVVGSPRLATAISSSVDGVRQLNRLCRLMAADCLPVPMEASA